MWQVQGTVQGSASAEADDQRLMNFTLARPTVSDQGNRSCRQVHITQCSHIYMTASGRAQYHVQHIALWKFTV